MISSQALHHSYTCGTEHPYKKGRYLVRVTREGEIEPTMLQPGLRFYGRLREDNQLQKALSGNFVYEHVHLNRPLKTHSHFPIN